MVKKYNPNEFKQNSPKTASFLTVIAQLIVLAWKCWVTAFVLTMLFVATKWMFGIWV